MTNLQKLTDLLCEVEEVKKDIMELRFGTRINILSREDGKIYGEGNFKYIKTTYGDDLYGCVNYYFDDGSIYNPNYETDEYYKIEILGNDLQDYHLRMYLELKGINYIIKNGELKINNIFIDELENKPLHKQSEETLGKIFNFLNDLKGKQ